jgi:hypothetical protein
MQAIRAAIGTTIGTAKWVAICSAYRSALQSSNKSAVQSTDGSAFKSTDWTAHVESYDYHSYALLGLWRMRVFGLKFVQF